MKTNNAANALLHWRFVLISALTTLVLIYAIQIGSTINIGAQGIRIERPTSHLTETKTDEQPRLVRPHR